MTLRTTGQAFGTTSTRSFVRVAWRALALGCCGSIVFALLVLVSPDVAHAASCSGPLNGGEIRVVIVVDAADLGGGSSATCLVVPAGTTGSQLLARRAGQLGTGSPRYGSSGLLCAIDGQPGTGCGDRNAGGFEYWAYFGGSSGSWVYGNINPFTKRLADGDIEGWRYVRGAGTGQDPPPRIAPSRSLFPALTPTAPVTPENLPSTPDPVNPANIAGRTPSVSSPAESTPNDGAIDATSATSTSTTTVDDSIAVDDVALAASSSSESSGSFAERWLALLCAMVLVAAFAGGAVVRTRRSR